MFICVLYFEQIKTGPVTAEMMKAVLGDFAHVVEEVASQTIKKVQAEIKNTEEALLSEVKQVPMKVQEHLEKLRSKSEYFKGIL